MRPEIRKLTTADAAVFWQLRLEALSTSPDAFATTVEEHRRLALDEVAKRLRPRADGSCVVGAFVDGRLVAIAGLARDTQPKKQHKALLWGVYAAVEVRGKGYGRAVVEEALAVARQAEGLRKVVLTVSSHNEQACSLYRSLGFERYGVEPEALIVNGSAVSEDLMALRLQ